MEENKKLTSEDFSKVWKDGGDQNESGLKLDLVEHLKRQRKDQTWNEAKATLIQKMDFGRFENSYEIQILQIGCGLGIDVLFAAQEATRLGKKLTIIGLDFNTLMIQEALQLVQQSKGSLSNDIKIEIKKGDVLALEYEENSFDIVRSDITLMHVDLDQAIKEVHRVLKVGGRLLSLEGGSSDTFSQDLQIMEIYDRVLPKPSKNGGTGLQLNFKLPDIGFEIIGNTPFSLLTDGHMMAFSDKDWVKLNGMGQMLVAKSILTQQQVDDFKQRYIDACNNKKIFSTGVMLLTQASQK